MFAKSLLSSEMQPAFFYDMESVRATFLSELQQGNAKHCPCCDRHAQIYRRKLHASMACQLIRLYALGGANEFIHASRLIMPSMVGIGDFSKCKYWGLILPKDKAIYDTDVASKATGFWRMTSLGEQFVRGEISIPREMFVFNDEVLGHSDASTTITQALGDKFNYDELMAGHL